MSNLIGVSGNGEDGKRKYKRSGVSASRLSDSRTKKLIGVSKKKRGGLAGGK